MPLAVGKSGEAAERGRADSQGFDGALPRYEQTILNFINDDGGTTSDSHTPKTEPMLSRKPQSNSSKAGHAHRLGGPSKLNSTDRDVLR